jgi:hypothetical protein
VLPGARADSSFCRGPESIIGFERRGELNVQNERVTVFVNESVMRRPQKPVNTEVEPFDYYYFSA